MTEDFDYVVGLGEEVLEHHGIKGMKWGVRRTPEQLGYKKKPKKNKVSQAISDIQKKSKSKKAKRAQAKKEEMSKEELREKLLKSNDPKFIAKHLDLLDTKEIQDRIDRINKEKTMKDLANPKTKSQMKVVEEYLKSAASMAESVGKIYDAYGKVTGSKQSGGSGKKKKKGGGQNQDSKDDDKSDGGNKDNDKKDDEDKKEKKPKYSRRTEQRAWAQARRDPGVRALMNLAGYNNGRR